MTTEDFEDEIAALQAEQAEIQRRVNVLQVTCALMGHPVPVREQGGMFGLASAKADPSYLDVERVRELLALPQSATAANVLRITASVH